MTDDRDRQGQDRCARYVSAGKRRAGRLGDFRHSVQQLQAAVLVEVGGNAEDDVGLARLRAHRRQVGERHGKRLGADLRRAAPLAPEMDAVDEGVDRGCGDPAGGGDGGIVAAAEQYARAGLRQARPYAIQELELAHALILPAGG